VRSAIVASVGLALAVGGGARGDEYVVREGDTCLDIIRILFPGEPNALARLHALNPELGPLPHELVPGMRLRVGPGVVAGQLSFVRPRVTSRRRDEQTWRTAPSGLRLFRLDQVLTLPEGSVEITFSDSTLLQIGGDTLVVIYGAGRRLAQLRKSGAVELVYGDLRLHLRELRGETAPDLILATPAARVATDARGVLVSVDAEKMSRVSVHEGRADVQARRHTARLTRGYGTRVAAGAPPEEPQRLLAAPVWLAQGKRDLAQASSGSGSATIGWLAVERAAAYRVSIARDERMNNLLLSTSVPAGAELRAELPGVPPGRYYARVMAVDAAGLAGLPAQRVIDVFTVRVERGAPAGAGRLHGIGELVVALPDLVYAEVTLDGKPVAAPFVVRDVGRHAVRVTPREGGTGVVLECEVRAPRAEVVIHVAEREVEVRLVDERGTLLSIVPGADFAVVGRRDTLLGPIRQVGQIFRATIESPGRGPVAVAALWEGRVIGVAEARLAAAAEP